MVRKNENVFFHKHFLNMDISFNSQYNALKFETCIYGLQMEGSVSQKLSLPRSDLRNTRKENDVIIDLHSPLNVTTLVLTQLPLKSMLNLHSPNHRLA